MRGRAPAAAALCLLTACAAHAQGSDAGECSIGAGAGFAPVEDGLFRLGTRLVREADLPENLQQALYDFRVDHHRKLIELADTAVLNLELDYRAKAAGRPREDVERDLLAPSEPGEEALAAFYEANRHRIGQSFEAVRGQLREHLMEQAVKSNRAELIETAKAREAFELAIAAPIAPVAELDVDGLPFKGATDAKVTIVEFADYQCPHCRRAATAMRALARRYGDAIRIVYADFPINDSGVSRAVAEGAACAEAQGRFWDYHDLAFEHQDALGMESPGEIAQALALDMDAFEACLASPFPRARVARGEEQARRLGLRFTPSVFVNGRRVRTHDFAEDLPPRIDALLAR